MGMSLVEQYHAEHKARLARMGGVSKFSHPGAVETELRRAMAPLELDQYQDKINSLKRQLDDAKRQLYEKTMLAEELQKVVARQRSFIIKITGDTETAVPRLAEIIHVVGAYYSVSREELVSERREKRIIIPRQIIYWLGKKYGHPLASIGRHLNKDHSSVHHGTYKTEGRLAQNENFQIAINEIVEQVSTLAEKRSQMARDLIAESGMP